MIPMVRFITYETLLISFNSASVMSKNIGQQKATLMVYTTPKMTLINDISNKTSPGSYVVLSIKYTTIIQLDINFEIVRYKNAAGVLHILPNVFLITVKNNSCTVLFSVHFCLICVIIAVNTIDVNLPYIWSNEM